MFKYGQNTFKNLSCKEDLREPSFAYCSTKVDSSLNQVAALISTGSCVQCVRINAGTYITIKLLLLKVIFRVPATRMPAPLIQTLQKGYKPVRKIFMVSNHAEKTHQRCRISDTMKSRVSRTLIFITTFKRVATAFHITLGDRLGTQKGYPFGPNTSAKEEGRQCLDRTLGER